MAAYTVKHLAKFIKNAKDKNCPYVIFTGAGCSESAGIPLASELVQEINQEFSLELEHLSGAEREKYGSCMAAIDKDDRRKLIEKHVKGAQINWAHIALATLIEKGFVKRILTFNFDNLLVRSCGLLGSYYPTYDFTSVDIDLEDLIADPSIIYLHGQSHGFIQLNSQAETQKHADKLSYFIARTLNQAPSIFIGYSGETDAFFSQLEHKYTGQHRLFWIGRSDDAPQHVKNALLQEHSVAHYIQCKDADDFLIQLAQELGCFPPNVFADPYGHLLNELREVCDFPSMPSDKLDLLSKVKKQLAKDRGKMKSQGLDLEALMMEGKYSEIIEVTKNRTLNVNDQRLLAWAYVMQGNALSKQARQKQDEGLYRKSFVEYARAVEIRPEMHEAWNNWGNALSDFAQQRQDEALYREGFAKYAKAVEIKPDKHEAWNNWGNALSRQAQQKQDEGLYREGFAKYAKAVEIKPEMHEAWNNWGNALSRQAQQKQDEALYREGFAKYAKAVEIKPDKHEAWSNWGNALSNLARQKQDEGLYCEGFAKYAKAVEIKPEMHEAWNNWGNALSDLARQKQDEALCREGFTKYAKAVEIKPEMHEAWNNWGNALSRQAQQKQDEALYREGFAKYAKAVEIKPDKHEAWNNWGNALLNLARQKQDEALYRESFAKYAKAVEIKPEMHEAWNNWGNALSDLARQKQDEALYREGFAKYAKAVEIKPDKYEAWNNWGNALSRQAQQKQDEALYRESFAKYAKAVEIKPEMHEAWNNWGNSLSAYAQFISGVKKKKYFKEAERILLKAEQINSKKVYNLACLYALQGNEKKCREKLLHCEQERTLPPKQHLLEDKDLEHVRSLDWFVQLIERL